MVYCTKCGTKNEEGAEYCSKCGANLGVSREQKFERRAEEFGRRAEEWGEQFGKRAEEECFGLPHGGTIAGLIIGIIIIIIALSWIPGLISPEVREVTEPLFWPVIIIIFGILIIAGALYKYSRR
ncbi:MAG: zinc ribbon domain-containing protein [Promethearchaeota archaeon]